MSSAKSRTALLAALLAATLAAGPAWAAGTDSPDTAPAPATAPDSKDPKDAKDAKEKDKKVDEKPADKKSEQQFLDRYRAARALVLEGKYEAALAAFKAIGRDEHPDVANYIGFTSRKLGRYDDARHWYEKALAADPRHVRTWQYYGMWHVEQGNMLKAHDHLEKIKLICGTGCREFRDLRDAMDGKISY